MTTPTTTPQRPAPLAQRIGAQTLFEARAVLRNGEQLILTLVLPTLLLVVLGRTQMVGLGTDDRIDLLAPGVLALAVMSTAFTSQAIATGFDRRNGVLRLMATTPLGRGGLLTGKVLAVTGLEVVQLGLLTAIAVALGWRPDPAGVGPAIVMLLLGTAAFTSLALLLAGLLRAEAVLAVANLVWVLLLAGGAVLFPADWLPGPLTGPVGLLPSGALGEGIRAAFDGEGLHPTAALVLTGWTVLLAPLTARLFRWQ